MLTSIFPSTQQLSNTLPDDHSTFSTETTAIIIVLASLSVMPHIPHQTEMEVACGQMINSRVFIMENIN